MRLHTETQLHRLPRIARVENRKNTNLNLGQEDIKGAHKNKPIQYGIFYQKGTFSHWKGQKYVFNRMRHLK